MAKHLQTQLNSLQKTPGIYKFLDDKKSVLYVGKAKNLRSRVGSYFKQNAELSLAKQDMLLRVADIATVPAKTEEEALVTRKAMVQEIEKIDNTSKTIEKQLASLEKAEKNISEIKGLKKVAQEEARVTNKAIVKELDDLTTLLSVIKEKRDDVLVLHKECGENRQGHHKGGNMQK